MGTSRWCLLAIPLSPVRPWRARDGSDFREAYAPTFGTSSISPHLRSMYSMPFTQVLPLWTGHVLCIEVSASSEAGRNVCIPAFDVQHAFYSSAPTLAADRCVCIPGCRQKCLH